MLGHVLSDYIYDDNATCKENGTETAICVNGECEYSETREKEDSKLSHNFGAYVSDNNGSCKNAGTETATCTECGEKDTRDVDGVAFNCNFQLVSDSATCTKQGEKIYKCSGCGDTIKEPSAAKGHQWDQTATCGTNASCANCSATQPVEHDYVNISTSSTTCEDDGYYTFKCNNCGDEYQEIYGFASGHSVSNWTLESETKVTGKTCEYKQVYTGHCSTCNNDVTKEEITERHILKAKITKEATCQEKGIMSYSCTVNGCTHTDSKAFGKLNEHKWDNGTEANGVITYHCTVSPCQETKSVISMKEESQATVDKDAISEVGEVELKNASIALDSSVLGNLNSDNVVIGADKYESVDDLTGITVTEDTKNKIGDSPIYDFTLTDGGNTLENGLGGKAVVKIPYTLQDGDDPECLAIWWITYDATTGENVLSEIEVEYANGYITFETDHFSYYTVTRLSPAERCKLYGHSYRVFETQATCTADGFKHSVCQRCGDSMKEVTDPATGHNVQEVADQGKSVGCTSNGKKVYKCTNVANGTACKYTYTEILKATGHEWEETDREEPSCEKPGHINKKCHHCDKEKKEDLLQKQHDFKVKESVKATCKKGGHTVYECKDCGYTYTADKVKALGHNYVESVVEPTCTEDGYTLKQCTRCNDRKTSHNVKGGHNWDIKKPTCGKGQICIDCGAEGAKATGKHKMKDGICSVCGEGCEHDFKETVIAPTCTKEGYTEKECSKCNVKEVVDYVKATGHKGDVNCEYCGEKIGNEKFYQNMLDSATSDSFAVVITNLVVYDEYYMSTADNKKYTITTMEFVEFSIGITADGKISGYGHGSLTIENQFYETNGRVEFEAFIKDNVFYAKVEGNGNYSSTHNEKMILKGSVAELFDMEEEGLGTIITAAVKDYKTELLPIFNQYVSENADKVNEVMGNFMELLFDKKETKDGFVLKLDYEKAKKLNDRLYSEDVYKLVDSLLGNGTYAKLGNEIDKMADKTVGYYLNEFYKRGYTKDEMVDIVYTIMKAVGEEMTKEQIKEEFFDNNEMTSMKISEVIEEFAEVDWEDISDYIHDLLDEIKGYSVYEIIVALDECSGDITEISFDGINEEVLEIKNEVNELIEIVADAARLSITTDKSGRLVNVDFGIEVDKVVIGEAKIVRDYTSTYDYNQLVQEVNSVTSGFEIDHRVFTECGNLSNYTEADVKEKDGHIYILNNTYDSGNPEIIDQKIEGNYRIYTVVYTSTEYYWVVDKKAPVIFTADCGNWWQIQSMYSRYYNYVKQKVEVKVHANGEVISQTPIGEAESNYSRHIDTWAFYILYNKVTGEVISNLGHSYGNMTRHNYIIDQSKSVAAEGCEGVGKYYYSCTLCGDNYSEYYTQGHNTYQTAELKDGADTCEDGVILKSVCMDCGKIVSEYETTYHEDATIARIELGSACGGYLSIYGCACGHTGAYIDSHDTNCYFDRNYVEHEDEYNYKVVYTCNYGLSPCGYSFAIESYATDVEGESCIKENYYTIYLDCDEFGENVQGETIDIYVGKVSAHDIYRTVELKEGSTTCEDGVIEKEMCSKCGFVLYEYESYYHSTATIEKIEIDSECGGFISIRGCACGYNERYIETHQVNCETTSEQVRYKDRYNYTNVYTCYYGDSPCGYRYAIEYSTKDIVGESCLKDKYVRIYLDCDDKGNNSKGATDEIYCGQTTTHDTYWTSELKEGATNCNEGVIRRETCYTCGMILSEYESYYHSSNVVEKIVVPSVCGESNINVIGCACGEGGYRIDRYNGACDIDAEQVRYVNSYNYTDVYTCSVTSPQCGYRYALEYYTKDIAGETCLKDWYVKIHLGCDINGENATQIMEEIYLGQVDIHNYEDQDEYFDYCTYVRNRVCTDCAYRETCWTSNNHDTEWYDNRDNNGAGTYGYKCKNCDYISETTQLDYYTITGERQLYYDLNYIYFNGERVYFYEKRESVSTFEMADDGYYDRQYRTETRTYIFPDDVSEEEKEEIIRYGYNDRTIIDEYIYFYEEGFAEAFREYHGRDYDAEQDGCAYVVRHQEGNESYLWGSGDVCDRDYEYFNNGTCTQFRYHKSTCERCGYTRVDEYWDWPNAENYDGHNYYAAEYDEYGNCILYRCGICGIENTNGADGEVVLENSSDIDNDSDTVIIGYFMRSKDFYEQANYLEYYTTNITLILHDVEDGEEDHILVPDVEVLRYEGEGNYLVYSLSEVLSAAEQMGYADGTYDIRLSFVPIGGSGDLDYGITITADDIAAM